MVPRLTIGTKVNGIQLDLHRIADVLRVLGKEMTTYGLMPPEMRSPARYCCRFGLEQTTCGSATRLPVIPDTC